MPEDNDMIINQFMWGYQPHFRIGVEVPLRMALSDIGFIGVADVLLVGFQVTGEHPFPICIEPEDGPYDPSFLTNVLSRGQELYEQHPDHDMIHTDQRAHEAYHENLRRRMRARAVAERLPQADPVKTENFSQVCPYASGITMCM